MNNSKPARGRKRSELRKERRDRKQKSRGRRLRLETLESRQLLTSVQGDFDNDGFDDLAIGVPYEDIGSIEDAGAVNVLYGTATGLSSSYDQIWHQDSPGIVEQSQTGDRFGQVLAVGDFNRDGYDDLAIGVPMEDVGTIVDAGVVSVLYGSSSRLTARGNEYWHQNVSGVEGADETGDRFGWSLAAGDFDND